MNYVIDMICAMGASANGAMILNMIYDMICITCHHAHGKLN